MLSESLKLVVALFGAWTLYAQVLILLRYDFTTLVSYSLLPVVLAPLIIFLMGRATTARPAIEHPTVERKSRGLNNLPFWFWLVCPFLIVGVYALTESNWAFWGLASAFLFVASAAFRSGPVSCEPSEHGVAPWERLVLLGICGIAVLVTAGTLRTDADDAFFVSLASSALDHPTAPLYGFDNLYRSGMPLLEQVHHLMQTYEYFVAMLSSISGISVHSLYYVLLPVFWVTISMLIHWLLLRRFLPPASALIGLVALVILLVVWGDGARTYGNFGFVRLYQGKVIYLLVALPMIIYSALAYSCNPNWRNWTLLMLIQCAGAGFSLTALFVGPLAAGVVMLAGMQWSRRSLWTTAAGVTASLFVLLAAVGMKLHVTDYIAAARLPPAIVQGLPATSSEVVKPKLKKRYQAPTSMRPTLYLESTMVLGLNRSNLVLLGLLLLPFLASQAKLRSLSWICNYLFVCILILLCPAVAKLLGLYVVDVLSWRIFWSWPVPLLLALGIGAVACVQQIKPWLRVASISGAIILFAFAGPLAVSRENWAWENIGRYKVAYPSHSAAQYLMSRIDVSRPALVPEEMAISLGGLSQAPPLIAIRRYYLRYISGLITKADLFTRWELLAYIDGRKAQITTDWVINQIEQRDIATVAFREDHRHADILSEALRGQGFETEHRFGYVLAIKAPYAPTGVQ